MTWNRDAVNYKRLTGNQRFFYFIKPPRHGWIETARFLFLLFLPYARFMV